MSRFVEPGLEGPLRALEEALRRQAFPTPPPGYGALTPARAMRAVLCGTWTGPQGPLPVVVKWHRPVTWSDRVARAVRGGRGPREGRLLLRLTAAGLPVPRALAFGDEGPDLLVTQRLPEVRALPPAAVAPAPLVREVAGLLARLFRAGLVHRDLTADNLALVDGRPVLIDLGGARLGGRRHARRVAHLAQAAHGLLFGATRATQARALKAWLEALGEPAGAWAHLAFEVERALARRRRRHHRRRERTLEEPGRRFARFEREGTSGVRRDPEAPPAWEAACGAWIDAAPAGARAFPGTTRVALAHLPGRTEPVVLKRFEPVRAGRRSRALTAFLRAAGLAERGLPSARPLLAAARRGGGSVLVSEALPAPSLWEIVRPGGVLAHWSPSRRRAFLTALGRALRRLHDADVSHRDLKPLNLLAVSQPGPGWTFPVVDLEGARLRYGAIGWRRRARDLARLAASLPLAASERLRVLSAYHRVLPAPPVAQRTLAERVHRHAERHRARLRTRYGGPPAGTAIPGAASGGPAQG